VKLSRRDLRRLIESVINEEEQSVQKVTSDIRRKDSDTETKASDVSSVEDIGSGQKTNFKNISGSFDNGIHYSFDSNELISDPENDDDYMRKLYIMKDKGNKQKSIAVRISYRPERASGKKGVIAFEVNQKQVRLPRFLIALATLGVTIDDIAKIIKEISTEIDTSQLEQEINESLSRGSLYRRRYYGRY